LEEVGLADKMSRMPGELSGGEQQRVAVARALANEPMIVLADEPTGNLDSNTSKSLMNLIRKMNEATGQTFIIITHDPQVAEATDRTVRMKDGVFVAEEEAVSSGNLCGNLKFEERISRSRNSYSIKDQQRKVKEMTDEQNRDAYSSNESKHNMVHTFGTQDDCVSSKICRENSIGQPSLLVFPQSNEYYSAVAETLDEAAKLMDKGFEYVCKKGDVMLFLRRAEAARAGPLQKGNFRGVTKNDSSKVHDLHHQRDLPT